MSAPAGWYLDPGGQPGLYRFWDGQTWSAATSWHPSAAPPSAVPPSATAPSTDPRAQVPSTPPSASLVPAGPTKRRLAWVLGAAAVLGVLVLALVLVLRSLGGGGKVADPTPTSSSTPDESCPTASIAGSTAPSTGDRVRSGRLSFPQLPAPFSAPKLDSRVPFGRDVQSQDATVEHDASGAPTWVAGVLIARLLAGDGFYGPRDGAARVVRCILGTFYGTAEVRRDDRHNAAARVDGHPAWLIESHLSFHLPDVRTTGELLIVVVVDTADSEAGLFYASVPDTAPQLVAPARKAMAQLQVSG